METFTSISNKTTSTDAFTSEIIRNYFLSTVREMIKITARAAYSTSFSEGMDFTCGLFDDQARLFAQSGGNPIHIGALDDELRFVLEKLGDVEPGDVLLHNDPFEGADHQSDVIVAIPMFADDEHVGFSVNRGHWADIGAMYAGGYGLASHFVQEGLIIPACKLYRGGRLDEVIRDFIFKNVRMPRFVWGDLQAQIASARAAAERMSELIERYGLADVRNAMEYSLAYARERFRDRLTMIPDGTYRSEDSLDDDGFGAGPHWIRLTIEKSADQVIVDFEGTDKQANGAANCTLAGTKAAVYTALKAFIDPEVPFNSGIVDLVDIRAPVGTLVNPTQPAPVSCAPADPTNRICETVLRCLVDVVPDRGVAGSYSSGLNAPGFGRTDEGDEYMWYVYGPGGCGARAGQDGLTTEFHTMAMCANESLEVWEARYPVRFVRRELRTDSGGPGRHRGGLGEVRVIECLGDVLVSGYMDRCLSQPWGVAGGLEGASNAFCIEREGVEFSFTDLGLPSPGKFSNFMLHRGDRFVVKAGGGGGFGPPEHRDLDLVVRDVREGYVSASAAEKFYRVALLPDGAVDEGRTRLLRSQHAFRD
ncbi:MAG: hydantoinase B/oxoprolinase family protein [Dehalococcoidia bacterium]